MLSAHSPSRPEALTYTRLRRVLQSIVGHVCAGGEVITRHGALNQSENIKRPRVGKHQTATGGRVGTRLTLN